MPYGSKCMGVVAVINPRRGMVAVATEDDAYTIIELLGDWDLKVGDVLTWANGHGLGSETYMNVTKGTQARVFVQNHSVLREGLRRQLML